MAREGLLTPFAFAVLQTGVYRLMEAVVLYMLYVNKKEVKLKIALYKVIWGEKEGQEIVSGPFINCCTARYIYTYKLEGGVRKLVQILELKAFREI